MSELARKMTIFFILLLWQSFISLYKEEPILEKVSKFFSRRKCLSLLVECTIFEKELNLLRSVTFSDWGLDLKEMRSYPVNGLDWTDTWSQNYLLYIGESTRWLSWSWPTEFLWPVAKGTTPIHEWIELLPWELKDH